MLQKNMPYYIPDGFYGMIMDASKGRFDVYLVSTGCSALNFDSWISLMPFSQIIQKEIAHLFFTKMG